MDNVLSPPQVFKVLPVLVCRLEQTEKVNLTKRIEELNKNLTVGIQILEEVIINDEKNIHQIEKYIDETDAILLYKPHLGLGNCVIKIVELNRPVILFNKEGDVRNSLDALEYVYPRKNVWVAIDYEDINVRMKTLEAKKKISNTKLLVLNADYPHWGNWLSRVAGGTKAIEQRFGIKVEYVQSDEVIKKWRAIKKERALDIAEKWIKEAEKVIEPTKDDLEAVAKLYLVMKNLLNERNAQGLTMAYGNDPLPVPCFAYVTLRDEEIPSACEADIISLLLMVMLHHLTEKPGFMGNTFVDSDANTLTLSHCVMPRKMAGYNTSPSPFTLRNHHWGKFLGSVSAFTAMKSKQEVTICRLSGDLKTMLVAQGAIIECEDLKGYCRNTVKIKISDIRKFVHSTSGNHHVVVYGDCRKYLTELNDLFGITTIEI
jgi:L-fucose isomerase-like protein